MANWEWFTKLHRAVYRKTGGLIGAKLAGTDMLLLTTTGRKTGKPRTSPVIFLKQGQDLIIAAHKGGDDRHPNWYLNLLTNPSVTVEVFWRRRTYHAEPIKDEGESKALIAQFPFGMAETLQEFTTRAFPVIRLQSE